MTSETPAPRSRPKSWLLVALGVVLVALLFTQMWSNGAPVGSRTPPAPRDAKPGQKTEPFDPQELNVRLEALEAARPDQGDMERNPFRFQPKATPPPANIPRDPVDTGPPPGPTPPPPPPEPQVPLKLTGFIELPGGGKLAALSDCKGATFSAAEGKTVDGQYRVVKIGIESVTVEFINGKGRQTLRVEGCPPR